MAGYGKLGKCAANASPTTYTTAVSATSQSIANILIITNRTNTLQTFSMRWHNGTPTAQDIIIENADIAPKEVMIMNISIPLATGEVLDFAGSTTSLNFTVGGLAT